MPKQAVSVTLERDNLSWLRGQVRSVGHRSLSEALDHVVCEARRAAAGTQGDRRSVAGTIAIDSADPNLDGADPAIRALFAAALGRGAASKRRPTRRSRRG
jgi:hypothetical protein